jgi:lipopolysaccharide biosynthesis protein
MMFWFRPRALQKLHLACKHLNSIPLEPLDDDGTPLHALERLVAHSCEAEGYKWALCSLEDEATQLRGCSPYDLSVLEPNPEAYLQATAWLARDMRNKERDYLLLSDELRGKVQIIAQKDLQIAASEALIWLQNQWFVKLTYFWVRRSKALLRKGLSWAK